MNKENAAYQYYDSMMLNYFRWQQNGIDKNACHGRFINAAINLAKMGMPNPFTFTQVEDNAQARPSFPGVVTAVKE